MVGTLRSRPSLPGSSHHTRKTQPNTSYVTSGKKTRNRKHNSGLSSLSVAANGINPEGFGDLDGQQKSDGTSSNDHSNDEDDDPDAKDDKPDVIAPPPGSNALKVAKEKFVRQDIGGSKKQEVGSEEKVKTVPQTSSQHPSEPMSPKAGARSGDTEDRSVFSESPEPEFDIPEDDDDYGDVDAVSQSSAHSDDSENSEDFEKKEEVDFQIDWTDPSTYNYDDRMFTNQHRFSIDDLNPLEAHCDDIFSGPVSAPQPVNVFNSKDLDTTLSKDIFAKDSANGSTSSSYRSHSSSSSSSDQSRSNSKSAPDGTDDQEGDAGDLTDECEYETDGSPGSAIFITPETPVRKRKATRAAGSIPPPPMNAFHRMPPRKRFRAPKDRVVVSTGSSSRGRYLQYHWPRDVRLSMIFGNRTGTIVPYRRIRTRPPRQIESPSTPGMADFIRPRLFREFHCNKLLQHTLREPFRGYYGTSFLQHRLMPSLPRSDLVDMSDISDHVELLDRAHEAADEFINFEDTSSAVGKSPFLTAADTQAIIGGSTPSNSTSPSPALTEPPTLMIVDENGVGQKAPNAAALMGMHDEGSANDEASQSTTTTSPISQGLRDQADTNKRRLDNMSDTKTTMSPPAKRQRLAMLDQMSA